MEFVYPIREQRQIEAMKRYLKGKNERDYIMFYLGVSTGLRIDDLLHITVGQVRGMSHVKVKERKSKRTKIKKINGTAIEVVTQKTKDCVFNDKLQKALKEYIQKDWPDDKYLFESRQGAECLPISRVQAGRILKEAAEAVGIKENIGCHSLRKTYAYRAYMNGIDITRIMALLNHSSPAITLRYIGITKQELDDIVINLDF